MVQSKKKTIDKQKRKKSVVLMKVCSDGASMNIVKKDLFS